MKEVFTTFIEKLVVSPNDVLTSSQSQEEHRGAFAVGYGPAQQAQATCKAVQTCTLIFSTDHRD